MGTFRSFLTELSAHNTFIFNFQDNNLNKSEWIFTNFDECIDMWRSALGLLIGKFRQFLTVICPHDNGGILSFHLLFRNVTDTKKATLHLQIFFRCLQIVGKIHSFYERGNHLWVKWYSHGPISNLTHVIDQFS